ncbi:MAG: metal-dependent transcriptional regulator [Ruminococcus sp.]|nr:metal-dependent transcriptional regulator [Ruminococcus sp.]
MKKIYESGENYLETILILQNRGVDVRSIDIVHEMDLSKPSVSRAMSILKEGGFINIDDGGYITFTDEGRNVAETIYERHRVLTDWLVDIGVDEKTAAQDACRIEHAISAESFSKLKEHLRLKHNKKD